MAKIAILGFGTVGSGVLEVLRANAQAIRRRAGQEVEVKYILDVRDFSDHPDAGLFVRDMDVILNDPEIQVVVETIGGTRFAYPYVKAALASGRSVATSNKEMVAAYGAELLALAKAKGAAFLFEASVGGGMPLIGPIHQSLAANQITGVQGIVNGTTNFYTLKMAGEQMGFDEALRIAQQLGYAETRDPSDDVDGLDAGRKIAILASLAFGRQISPQDLPTRGIRQVTVGDIEAARSLGCGIKLIAWARRDGQGGIYAGVEPMLVPARSRLYPVDDVFNAVLVRGDMTGEVMFFGKGAGKLPTASAVAADVIEALRSGARVHDTLFWEPAAPAAGGAAGTDPAQNAYYVRIQGLAPDALPELYGPGEPVSCPDGAAWLAQSLTAAQLEAARQAVEARGGRVALALRRLDA